MVLPSRLLVAAAMLSAMGTGTVLAQLEQPRIESLITDGWEVAGYIAVADNRSLILFKHKEHRHLVQCSVLVDAMRNPRVLAYCYELR